MAAWKLVIAPQHPYGSGAAAITLSDEFGEVKARIFALTRIEVNCLCDGIKIGLTAVGQECETEVIT